MPPQFSALILFSGDICIRRQRGGTLKISMWKVGEVRGPEWKPQLLQLQKENNSYLAEGKGCRLREKRRNAKGEGGTQAASVHRGVIKEKEFYRCLRLERGISISRPPGHADDYHHRGGRC